MNQDLTRETPDTIITLNQNVVDFQQHYLSMSQRGTEKYGFEKRTLTHPEYGVGMASAVYGNRTLDEIKNKIKFSSPFINKFLRTMTEIFLKDGLTRDSAIKFTTLMNADSKQFEPSIIFVTPDLIEAQASLTYTIDRSRPPYIRVPDYFTEVASPLPVGKTIEGAVVDFILQTAHESGHAIEIYDPLTSTFQQDPSKNAKEEPVITEAISTATAILIAEELVEKGICYKYDAEVANQAAHNAALFNRVMTAK